MTPTPTDSERQRAREIVTDVLHRWSRDEGEEAITSALAASREAAMPKWRPALARGRAMLEIAQKKPGAVLSFQNDEIEALLAALPSPPEREI